MVNLCSCSITVPIPFELKEFLKMTKKVHVGASKVSWQKVLQSDESLNIISSMTIVQYCRLMRNEL